MRAIHHVAIVTTDFVAALRFWRDGLGLVKLLDHTFTGDWRTLFDADADQLQSIFLGDPDNPNAGIVELVQFAGDPPDEPVPGSGGPRRGFFLLSLERDVEASLATLADLGFSDGVRRITMPGPKGKTVPMAVVNAPDGVTVELIGSPA